MASVDIALTGCRVHSSGVDWSDQQIADTGLPVAIEADGNRVRLLGVYHWASVNALRFDIATTGRFVAGSLYFRLTVGSNSAESPELVLALSDDRPTLTLGSSSEGYADWLRFARAAIALFPTPQTNGTLRVQNTPFASGTISNKIATLSENDTHDFNSSNIDPADGAVTWNVKSGGGAISSAGVYTPPDVTANTAVTIALLVNGSEVDTVTFTVTPHILPTIANKITTLAETATHDFNIENAANAAGVLSWRVKTGSVGTINANGVYSIGTDAVNVRTDTPVTVELIDTSGSTVTVRDSDTFVVTPVFTGTISNKIATLEETDTHDFNATGVSGPGDPVTWRVNSGGGSITNAGAYTPPDVTANRAVTVALLVGGRQVDTDTFTVNVVHTPVQSTQYAYIRSGNAPALPAAQNQRSTAGAPSGWSLNDQAVTTSLDVYRISRRVTTLGGVFQSGDTDWAWDPATQPGTPYRLRLPTTRTQYAYLRAASLPTLPSSTAEALPATWQAANPGADTTGGVYRIRRTVNERLGAFVSASSWVWDPGQANQPWQPAATTTRKQYAFRRAETLDESTGLPSSTAQALPAGWSATAPVRTQDAGVWRISRTVTERLGAFVSANAWAWDPAYSGQPYVLPLSALSDSIRRWITTVRHRETGIEAQVIWALHADVPLTYAERAIYQKVGINDDLPAAPAGATVADFVLANLGAWSIDFPDYNAQTEKVACTSATLGSDNSLSDWSTVFVCESPADINTVYRISVEKPDALSNTGTARVPADTLDDAPDSSTAGAIWANTGHRNALTQVWTWDGWIKVEGTDARQRDIRIYVSDKTDTTISVGTAKPHETPTSYRLRIFTAAGTSALQTRSGAGSASGFTATFSGLTESTLYRVEGVAIYGTGDTAEPGPKDTHFIQTGVEIDGGVAKIVGLTPSSVKVTVPAVDGNNVTYDWEYDVGRSNTLVWIRRPRTTTNETTIPGLRNNSTLRVRYRVNVGSDEGDWRSIGEGYVPQAAAAPENVSNVVLTINADGTYNVTFDAPVGSARPIDRYGAILFRNGQFAGWFDGSVATSRDRDGYNGRVLYDEGDYHAEVRAVSLSATDDSTTTTDDLTGDWVASNVVRWGGVPLLDDTDIPAAV